MRDNNLSSSTDVQSSTTVVASHGFPERLRLAMRGRSIREFAASASMSAGTLHNYLNNESLPTLDKLLALINTAGVNVKWLATGGGPMDDYNDIRNDVVRPVDVKLLTKILECVEESATELGAEISIPKKCAVTSSIYDILRDQPDSRVNLDKIRRLIHSSLAL